MSTEDPSTPPTDDVPPYLTYAFCSYQHLIEIIPAARYAAMTPDDLKRLEADLKRSLGTIIAECLDDGRQWAFHWQTVIEDDEGDEGGNKRMRVTLQYALANQYQANLGEWFVTPPSEDARLWAEERERDEFEEWVEGDGRRFNWGEGLWRRLE